ncbi:TPA: hypothetical protein NJ081_003607 [Vibrio parahaemolyticus]|nr:hypothetical protein [Vibrio parahaemolyticus]
MQDDNYFSFTNYFDTMKGFGTSASKPQEAAFKAVPDSSGIYDVLEEAARGAETDETREKIVDAALKCRKEDTATTERIMKANADNNDTLKYFAYGITGVALLAGGYGYYLANKNDDD